MRPLDYSRPMQFETTHSETRWCRIGDMTGRVISWFAFFLSFFGPINLTQQARAEDGVSQSSQPDSEANRSVPEIRTVRFLQSNQASKRDIGSAGALRGRVHIYHIFASDRVSRWTDEDKQQVKDRLATAYEFIRRESARFGKRITFTDEYAQDVHYADVLPTDSLANPAWTENVITAASGEAGVALVARLKQQHRAEHVTICMHIRKPALSYNLAYYKNVSPGFAAERMICFSEYPDMRPTAAATYAHEILHLFGAGDLYFPYDRDGSRKDIAQRLFPNDIMYRVDYDISRLYVGPFTAYRVGWRDELDPDHRVFED